MIDRLSKSGRLKITLLLTVMALFCFCLSIIRFFASENLMFLFLNWNLFLAFIPWATTTLLTLYNPEKNKPGLVFLLLIWTLFFPNSPYILTDLLHLRARPAVPIWFDLILILSFAWSGLAFGFASLLNIESLLTKYIKPKQAQIIIVLMLFVASFGVYIGRYLRWNSWDVINDPSSLFADLGDRFISPFSHPRTWGLTILLGVLLNIMYWSINWFHPAKSVTVNYK